MPLLWLLLPLAAAYVYYALPRSSTSTSGGGGDVSLDPDLVLDAETAEAFPIPASKLGDYALTLPAQIFTLPAGARPYANAIETTEARYDIPQSILARLLYQESRFRPDVISGATRSPAGAQGIAQFMPGTARDLGIDPLDPQAAIEAAGRYLRAQYDKFGNWAAALAAYNWGPGNVARKGIAAAPAETQNYVARILGLQ